MRQLIRASAILVVPAMLMAGEAAAQQINARLGHCTATADSVHQSAVLTKEAFERLSNGRLTLTIFGGCQLGTLGGMLNQVQLGTLDLTLMPPAFAVGASRNFSVPDAPGIFDDMAHAARAVQHPPFREKYVNVARDKGLMVISLWVHSGTSYASLAPIRKIDDFRGQKIRVLATKVETDLMARLGATGVPVDFAELLPALQQKRVDAARSSIVVMGGLKFFTVTKFITVVHEAFIPLATFMSPSFFDKLPADLKDVVLAAGREVETKIMPVAIRLNQDFEGIWRENGAEIIRLAPTELAEMTRRAAPVGDEVIGGNPDTRDLYAILKQSAAATRQR